MSGLLAPVALSLFLSILSISLSHTHTFSPSHSSFAISVTHTSFAVALFHSSLAICLSLSPLSLSVSLSPLSLSLLSLPPHSLLSSPLPRWIDGWLDGWMAIGIRAFPSKITLTVPIPFWLKAQTLNRVGRVGIQPWMCVRAARGLTSRAISPAEPHPSC